tara:strand:- start:5 stop:724 length:720 start_codon:yes stop_codon:yes gene_type:complete
MDNKCPRCDDYDEITEELKKEKENRERGAKDELRKCEEINKSRNKNIKGLEKKILTMTIIAVVAGTVLGKEVLDKITSYIESFNSIKNAATKLTTSVDDNSNKEVAKVDDEQEEIVEDIRTLTFAPRTIDTGDWPALMSTSDIKAYQSRMNTDHMLPLVGLIDTSEYEVSTLADILLDDMLDEMILSLFTDDVVMIPPIQSASFEPTPTIPYSFVAFEVPESYTSFLFLPVVFVRRRRK